MWNPKDWTCLHSAFPSKSKIVITTRKKGVATGFEFVHKMKLLETSNALELLQKTLIYGRNTSQGDIMEKIGNKTITQCGHLPLAISAVGKFLWKEESLDGYAELDCDRIFSRSILEDESRCMSVLAMSYDDLPQHLQHCFLCLGVFSDGMIDIQSLYFMWMAEGIILLEKLRRGQTMLEVAEQYLDKLDSQSMVILDTKRVKKKNCQIHMSFRELCLQKCLAEEFVKLVYFRGGSRIPSLVEPARASNAYRLTICADRVIDNGIDIVGLISESAS